MSTKKKELLKFKGLIFRRVNRKKTLLVVAWRFPSCRPNKMLFHLSLVMDVVVVAVSVEDQGKSRHDVTTTQQENRTSIWTWIESKPLHLVKLSWARLFWTWNRNESFNVPASSHIEWLNGFASHKEEWYLDTIAAHLAFQNRNDWPALSPAASAYQFYGTSKLPLFQSVGISWFPRKQTWFASSLARLLGQPAFVRDVKRKIR